ncbi:MAG: hypothetical protein IID13_03660 [Candidatus Marinimicrobia bacterium]|nr:hypothetical protein [Candidatus Neomarinimicrobiota bacterium]
MRWVASGKTGYPKGCDHYWKAPCWTLLSRLPSMEGVERCVITKEVVCGDEQPVLVRRKVRA